MNRYEFALFVQHENLAVPFQGEGRKAEVRGEPPEARRLRLPPVAAYIRESVPKPRGHYSPIALSPPRSPHNSASPWVCMDWGAKGGVSAQCLRLRAPVSYQLKGLNSFGPLANQRMLAVSKSSPSHSRRQ